MPATPATTRTRSDKRDRFSARLSAVQKGLLQQAADIEGRTLTDFVLAHAQEAAVQTIREHAILSLSARDSLAFMQALQSSWEPDDELRAEIQQLHGLLGND